VNENRTDNHQFTSGFRHSRGKLLLTAEYMILCGAEGLALPLQCGQGIRWNNPGEGSKLEWLTLVKDREWFTAIFCGPDYSVVSASDGVKAAYLRGILSGASGLPGARPVYGSVISSVEFEMDWGLGSSSSLISNIAYMFDVDPFALHFQVSRGSGYDIACARSNTPILYRLYFPEHDFSSHAENSGSHYKIPEPAYKEAGFYPAFRDELFFAWTGRKQNSARAVENFSRARFREEDILKITRITNEIIKVADSDHFSTLLMEHDMVMSAILGVKPLSGTDFYGFPGYVKSLGAWGGDFILIVWKKGVEELLTALKQKGVSVVFSYETLISSFNGN
jgi:hypothetical protein